MKILILIWPRISLAACASAFLLTGCVSGNSKLQAEYDRGQSDAVKELYWAKERAKATDRTTQAHTSYLPITTPGCTNNGVVTVPTTEYLPVEDRP